MSITKNDIAEVAHLARLEMDDAELEKFTGQLQKILDFASTLDALDLSGVEPTYHSVPVSNVFREDEVHPSLPVEDVIANAPEPAGHFFSVPKIIDDGEGH